MYLPTYRLPRTDSSTKTPCDICPPGGRKYNAANLKRHKLEIHGIIANATSAESSTQAVSGQEEVQEEEQEEGEFADYFSAMDEEDRGFAFDSSDESDNNDDEEINSHNAFQHNHTWSSNRFYPFKNEMEMILLMFFKASQDRVSNRKVKKWMAVLRKIVELSHKERDVFQPRPERFNPLINIPKDDRICRSHNPKRKFPRLKVSSINVPKGQGLPDATLSFIKPSDHLRLVMANPNKVMLINSLPDFTADQRYTLNQGIKWKEDPHFQSPMIAKELYGGSSDFWLGDIVAVGINNRYVISKFFTIQEQVYASAFEIEFDDVQKIATVLGEKVTIPLEDMSFLAKVTDVTRLFKFRSKTVDRRNGQVIILNQPLECHINAIETALYYRRHIPKDPTTGQQLKVRVVPISLFSDDTSGNRSKKWNCFDSWVMGIAAFPLVESNKYENHLFVCTSNHSVNAMEMTGPLSDDLLKLQGGVMMHDIELNRNVWVIAPVLFLRGDNVRQAEMTLSKGSRAKHPCRYCYWQADPTKPVDANGDPEPLRYSAEVFNAEQRTADDMIQFAVNKTESRVIPVLLPNRGRGELQPSFETIWDNLSFKFTGGENFMKLTALDLSKDSPVEILHTMELGMVKYCFSIAFNNFLNQNQLDALTKLFRSYNSKALHRNLTSSLKTFRSFLGRDYKILVQLLPSLLKRARLDNPALFSDSISFDSMFQCFDKLGSLASLCYIEKINDFSHYKILLEDTISETIIAMDNLQHTMIPIQNRRRTTKGTTAISKMNFSSLCNRLKAHLLVHLPNDMERFAGGPHTEAEKCEQQHKFMRELLCHTNRQNGSRDVAIRFAEEYMLRHICQGGAFLKDPSSSVWQLSGAGVRDSYGVFADENELSLADNTNSSRKLVVEMSALFRHRESGKSSGLTLGKIVSRNENRNFFVVDQYDFLLDNAFSDYINLSIFRSYLTDDAGNYITRKLPNPSFVIEDSRDVVEIFDMSQSPVSNHPQLQSNSFLSVNKSRFGTLWWLHNTTINFEKVIR